MEDNHKCKDRNLQLKLGKYGNDAYLTKAERERRRGLGACLVGMDSSRLLRVTPRAGDGSAGIF
jgi:hypothetical protein